MGGYCPVTVQNIVDEVASFGRAQAIRPCDAANRAKREECRPRSKIPRLIFHGKVQDAEAIALRQGGILFWCEMQIRIVKILEVRVPSRGPDAFLRRHSLGSDALPPGPGAVALYRRESRRRGMERRAAFWSGIQCNALKETTRSNSPWIGGLGVRRIFAPEP
jgi:hypothetical protein